MDSTSYNSTSTSKYFQSNYYGIINLSDYTDLNEYLNIISEEYNSFYRHYKIYKKSNSIENYQFYTDSRIINNNTNWVLRNYEREEPISILLTRNNNFTFYQRPYIDMNITSNFNILLSKMNILFDYEYIVEGDIYYINKILPSITILTYRVSKVTSTIDTEIVLPDYILVQAIATTNEKDNDSKKIAESISKLIKSLEKLVKLEPIQVDHIR